MMYVLPTLIINQKNKNVNKKISRQIEKRIVRREPEHHSKLNVFRDM